MQQAWIIMQYDKHEYVCFIIYIIITNTKDTYCYHTSPLFFFVKKFMNATIQVMC